MPAVGTSATSPVTVASGTYATQYAIAVTSTFINRVTLAMTEYAEYVINSMPSSTAGYADLAAFARSVATNPLYVAQVAAFSIVNDPTNVTGSCTDQQIANRIAQLWPVWSLNASTVNYNTGI